ncbi:hypothetical protein DENSPDRAFT_901951 [Dentipellis sp. KUC8613]|nr:hypothetical protein DENSPDRAFT_901951 [Dentipellis sp. KUC8613]
MFPMRLLTIVLLNFKGRKNGVTAPAVRGTRPAGFGYEGSVTLKAVIVRDVVDFGGGGASNIPFAAATEVSAILAGRPEEGAMGFGLAGGSGMGMPPIVDLLASSGLIPSQPTSRKLARGSDGRNDGEVVMGGVNPAEFIPQSMVTVRNLDPIHWQVKVAVASIGNVHVINTSRLGYIDTGASYFLMSFADVLCYTHSFPAQ